MFSRHSAVSEAWVFKGSRSVRLALVFLALFGNGSIQAQLLFPESFTLILDTTRHIRGSITPSVRIQTQKELLIELENTADLSIRAKGYSLTFANRFELSQYGDDVLLSGGYVYAKLRQEKERRLMFEYYGQLHWAEARGMDRKYAAGVNARWRIVQTEKLGVFAGAGPFYEFERWTYRAVPDDRLPTDQRVITNELFKVGAYVGYKHWVLKNIFLDISLYYQTRPEYFFSAPRVGSSSRVGFQINKYLQLTGIYQNIHDEAPVVPIDPWFHKFVASITLTL